MDDFADGTPAAKPVFGRRADAPATADRAGGGTGGKVGDRPRPAIRRTNLDTDCSPGWPGRAICRHLRGLRVNRIARATTGDESRRATALQRARRRRHVERFLFVSRRGPDYLFATSAALLLKLGFHRSPAASMLAAKTTII